MTAPVPPGRVQAPPLTAAEAAVVARFDAASDLDLAAEARQEAVAWAMKMWDGTTSSDSAEEWFRGLAATAIAADDAWRAGHAAAQVPAVALWKEDDPDPTPHGSNNFAHGVCGERSNDKWVWVCTWDRSNHPAWHVAGDGDEVCAVWPVADHEPAAAIQRVEALADVLAKAPGNGPNAAALIFGALAGGDKTKLDTYEARFDSAVCGVQPAATEPGQ
jgi:hypothetical protein